MKQQLKPLINLVSSVPEILLSGKEGQHYTVVNVLLVRLLLEHVVGLKCKNG